jgi:hypothetical protein
MVLGWAQSAAAVNQTETTKSQVYNWSVCPEPLNIVWPSPDTESDWLAAPSCLAVTEALLLKTLLAVRRRAKHMWSSCGLCTDLAQI